MGKAAHGGLNDDWRERNMLGRMILLMKGDKICI